MLVASGEAEDKPSANEDGGVVRPGAVPRRRKPSTEVLALMSPASSYDHMGPPRGLRSSSWSSASEEWPVLLVWFSFLLLFVPLFVLFDGATVCSC